MKALCLLVISLVLFPALSVRSWAIGARHETLRESSAAAYWPKDSVLKVYFVRNMFTADQRQLLWNTIETWSQHAKQSGSEITFMLGGESGGLIDCVGCLTIARQGFEAGTSRQRVSFNALRHDDTGRLVSAWIGFERLAATEVDLRTLMLQALERGVALTGPHKPRLGHS